MCKEMNVTYLGQLPLNPMLGKACDEGEDILLKLPAINPIVDSKSCLYYYFCSLKINLTFLLEN